MAYINQHRWPPLSYEQAMEEYRKKYLEEESDESAGDSENNESEGEGGSDSEGGAGDGGEGEEGKSEKRKLRRGRKGSVIGQRRRTCNKAVVAAVTSGRGRTNNKYRVM